MTISRHASVCIHAMTLLTVLLFVCHAQACGQCSNLWKVFPAPSGVDGTVYATTLWDPDGSGPALPLQIVAGDFTMAGSQPANRIAAWNETTGQWTGLGSGMDGSVHALAIRSTGELVAGGYFTTAGGVSGTSYIAKWNGTTWSPLGQGTDQPVLALAAVGSNIYAGGLFSQAFDQGGTVFANGVARWDGVSWSRMDSGVNGKVCAMATMPNGSVIVGGSFSSAGTVNTNHIAGWGGSAWFSLGTGLSGTGCYALTVRNGALIVGGEFAAASGVSTGNIAQWNGGNSWVSLDSLNGPVLALAALANGDVVAGGAFDAPGNGIARWTGGQWQALGSGVRSRGSNGVVHALAQGTFAATPGILHLFAGGTFDAAGPNGSTTNIAGWVQTGGTETWYGLGRGMQADVYAVSVLPSGTVLAGGAFASVGNVGASAIASWDPSTSAWSPLGAGVNGAVTAIAPLPTGEIAVGGNFTTAGGVPANRIAVWNRATRIWSPLGSGLNGSVEALLALPSGELVVGGAFTTAGGGSANGIAAWSPATRTWAALGTGGLNGFANALLALPTGEIVVGGSFTIAGGGSANRIAKWTGPLSSGSWSTFGAGMNGTVRALCDLGGGDFVAGGEFSTAGGPTAHAQLIARWNSASSAWSPLGTGLSGSGVFLTPSVRAVVALPDGDLLAGGTFDNSPSYVARWNGSNWAPQSTFPNRLSAFLRGIHQFATLPNGDVVTVGSFDLFEGFLVPVTERNIAVLTTTCPAMAVSYGTGCAGSAGAITQEVVSLAWTGGRLQTRTSGFAPGAIGLGILGASETQLPLGLLFPVSAPGCSLLVDASQVLSLSVMTPVAGQSVYALGVPDSSSLIGAELALQTGQIEAAPTLLSAANAVKLTVGRF